MEFIDGVKISEVAQLEAAGIDLNVVAQIMTEAYCEQILVHGFFHADHTREPAGLARTVVVFLDSGSPRIFPTSSVSHTPG